MRSPPESWHKNIWRLIHDEQDWVTLRIVFRCTLLYIDSQERSEIGSSLAAVIIIIPLSYPAYRHEEGGNKR